MNVTRDDAYELLKEYVKNENLQKPGLAVEAAMDTYVKRRGGDEETWRITGLIHDFDYEKWPETGHR